MFYKGLGIVANTSSPIVVVLSGSMEPAFQRGDLLFLWNRESRLKVGDIIVYDSPERDIPIVHRILREHSSDKKQLILTKGDNNPVDDLFLYGRKKHYLERDEDVTGVTKWYIPYVGYPTIYLSENPKVKVALLSLLAIVSFVQRE